MGSQPTGGVVLCSGQGCRWNMQEGLGELTVGWAYGVTRQLENNFVCVE